MKFALSLLTATTLFIFFSLAACDDEKGIQTPPVKEIPTTPIVPEDPKTLDELLIGNPNAKFRADELVEMCGIDVFDSTLLLIPTSKGCTFRVKLDGEFLKHEILKTGLLHDENELYGAVFAQPSPKDIAATPEKWDIRTYGKAANVVPNDQDCGDCWAQATAQALELIVAAKSSKVLDLSVQFHISSCSAHGSCGGGYMSAPDILIETGNPFELQDPYLGRNSKCKFSYEELGKGFETKVKSAPYVGTSLAHSRFFHGGHGATLKETLSPGQVADTKAMMVKYKSPAVVTIAAISSSGGTINTCSSINSSGNHMQAVVGWGPEGDPNVADVMNSWGPDHGINGVTRIKWECGEGKLNRGLGRSARVYEFQGCDKPADPFTGGDKTFIKSSPEHGVWIGRKPSNGQTCGIEPKTGLSDIDVSGCRAFASPDRATEYHITAYQPECDDTKSAMVLITPYVEGDDDHDRNIILTPHGEVDLNDERN